MFRDLWRKLKHAARGGTSWSSEESLEDDVIRKPMALNRKSSILCQLYEKKHFTSKEFRRLWDYYDKDGSGFLELAELERFLRDLTDVTLGDGVDETEYEKFKLKIMSIVDDNHNGKLEAKELSKIIPTEENFLLAYSIQSQKMGTVLSTTDFLEIWLHYDQDCSGFLDYEEAKQFMKDMLKVNQCQMDTDNVEYLDAFFKTFDIDDNGVIEIDEMSSIFPVEEKFTNALKQRRQFPRLEFDRIFESYDKDKSGFLEGGELEKFINDLSKTKKGGLTESEITEISGRLFQMFTKSGETKISRNELSLILSSHCPAKVLQFKNSKKSDT